MADVSSRDLRNHTADVLRRVESGERIRVSVNRRPVAELVPLGRPQWVAGPAIEAILRDSAADPALLDDLAAVRGQVIEPDGARVPRDDATPSRRSDAGPS